MTEMSPHQGGLKGDGGGGNNKYWRVNYDIPLQGVP